MKLLKLIAWLLLILVGLVVASAAALLLFLHPNDYKDEIAALVKEKTGRALSIEGDIQVSVFPWLGITLGRMDLGNAEGFGPEPFARVGSAEVKVKLLPLLRKQVEMDTIVLEGLTLNLAVNRTGRSNWQDLGRPSESKAESADHGAAAGGVLAAFSVAGLDVRDARIHWRDEQDGTDVTVTDLALRGSHFTPGRPFGLELQGNLASTTPPMNGPFSLSTQATLQPETQLYRLQDLVIDTNLKGPDLPGRHLDLRLSGDIRADMAKQQVDLGDLQGQLWGVPLSGSLQATKIVEAPQVAGQLEIQEFSPRDVIKRLEQPVPATADPTVLARASGHVSLRATPSAVDMNDIVMKLDDTSLTGTVHIDQPTHPKTRFDLNVDAIDLDRYLPPPSESSGGAEKRAPPAPGAAAALIPVDVLRGLALQGDFRVAKMKVADLRLQDVVLHVDADDGLVQLHPLRALLYQGEYQGNVRIDARRGAPELSVDESLRNLQIGPLLSDMQGKDSWLIGSGGMTAKLRASGATDRELRRTLSGNVAFAFHDGAVKGVNIADMLRRAKATLDGKTLPPSSAPEQTDFSELSGTLEFGGGEVRNNDLAMKSPLLRVGGQGQADLLRENVDYLLKATVVGTLKGQGGKELDDLRGITVPVKVHGPLYQPKFSLDVEVLAAELAKTKVEQKAQKLEDKLKEKLEKKLPGVSERLPGLTEQIPKLFGR